MAIPKKVTEEAPRDLSSPEMDTPVVPEKSSHTTAHIFASSGGKIRTYDAATHGENFHDLAKQFVAHTPGARIELK